MSGLNDMPMSELLARLKASGELGARAAGEIELLLVKVEALEARALRAERFAEERSRDASAAQAEVARLRELLNGGKGAQPGAMASNLEWYAKLLAEQMIETNHRAIMIDTLQKYATTIGAALAKPAESKPRPASEPPDIYECSQHPVPGKKCRASAREPDKCMWCGKPMCCCVPADEGMPPDARCVIHGDGKPASEPKPNDIPRCELCGEPMPKGEEMFKYHGYSGPCPKREDKQ